VNDDETIEHDPARNAQPTHDAQGPPGVAPSVKTVDRFELIRELGRGGMGAVYEALDPEAGRRVALKVVLESGADASRLERLRREGQITAELRHPGIVGIHAAGEVDGRPYLAYELVEGARPLDEAWGDSDLEGRLLLVRDAARAVGAAHARGVVHRDLKPENILVDGAGRVRVADFGLALAADLERLTLSGALVGTPLFMSPEQLKGSGVGPSSDVWSLGVVLYQASTGELPFRGSTLVELWARIHEGAEDPRRLAPDLDADLAEICNRALAPDTDRRYPNGLELAEDLDRFLAGDRPRGAPRSLRRWVRRRPWALALVGSIAVVGGALSYAPTPSPTLPRRSTTSPKQAGPPPSVQVSRGQRDGVGATGWPRSPSWTLQHSAAGFVTPAFESDDSALSLGDDGLLRRWDLRTRRGTLIVDLREEGVWTPHPENGVMEFLATPGAWVCATTRSGLLWGQEERVVVAGVESGWSLALGPRQGAVLVGRRGLAQVWRYPDRQRLWDLPCDGQDAVAGAVSPDGERAAVFLSERLEQIGGGMSARRMVVCDLKTGQVLAEVDLRHGVRCATWGSGAVGLVVGTTAGQITRLDPDTGEPRGEFVDPTLRIDPLLSPKAHRGSLRMLRHDAARGRLYAVGRGVLGTSRNELTQWDVRTRQVVGPRRVLDRELQSADLSPNGRLLLVGGRGGLIEAWPTAD
jgi:serine/threonine protein kinase